MKIQDLKEGCAHGEYYCSTDKKWKCRQGPKQSRKVAEGKLNENASRLLSAEDRNGVITVVVQAPDGTKRSVADANPRYIQRWLMKYDLRLPQSITSKFIESVKQDVAEGLPQTLRKVVPGYAKREIDKKMDAEKFGRTDVDKDANFQRYKKIQDKLKEQGVAEEKTRLDPKCWAGYKKDGTKIKGGVRVNNCVKEELEETYDGDEFFEAYGELWFNEDEQLDEAEYQGRSVPLGKPMQGDVKKFKVYVKDPSTGNVKKVNFGDPDMKIRKSNPAARRSFRARHNCDNPGPRTSARYWSCRKW
jgi:hypothetical protein